MNTNKHLDLQEDIIAAIAQLRMLHKNLLAEAERVSRTIEDLKRAREMARALNDKGRGE